MEFMIQTHLVDKITTLCIIFSIFQATYHKLRMEFNIYTISKKGFFSSTYLIRSGDEIVYKAKPALFANKCSFTDVNDREIFFIKRKTALFKSIYHVLHGGEKYAEVLVKGAFKTKLIVDTEDGQYLLWSEAFHKSFTVSKSDREIGKISRKSMFKTNIGVAIDENEDNEFILALVIVIEMIIKSKRSKSG